MERLTVADELMENGKRRCHIIDGRAVREQAMKFYWRLKKYEDLGLSPEQIEAMQQHNHILIEELAEYEQLKKQGLLLKLPCKPNEIVFIAHEKFPTHKNLFVSISGIVSCLEDGYAIGSTKEEAEAKLKELENE